MRSDQNQTEQSQRKFFDKYVQSGQCKINEQNISIFTELIKGEQEKGFRWLGDCNKLLDYGCGVGNLINEFNNIVPSESRTFYGVDISNASIEVCKSRFKGVFSCISNNQMEHIPDSSIDGAYLIMILHHSENHMDIFRELHRVLKPGGKIFISDLTNSNPIINLGRVFFGFLPKSVKKRFSDDLVVDNEIPEKLAVNVRVVLQELKNVGFQIERIERSQLFFFLFDWSDKVFRTRFGSHFKFLIKQIFRLEKFLIRLPFIAYFSHVFDVYAVVSLSKSSR